MVNYFYLTGQSKWLKKIQRMHSWYTRACRLDLKDMWARYPPDVFRPKFDDQADIIFDFRDIQETFHLKDLELNMVRL
jgi:hypothetical protein